MDTDGEIKTFMEEIKKSFKITNEDLINEDIFEWNIENWKDLKNENESETFELCGLNWNLILFPNGSDVNNEYISLFLQNFDALNYYNYDDNYKYNDDNQYDINVFTRFILYLRKNDDFSKYEAKQTSFTYDNNNYYYGVHQLVEIKKIEELLKNNKLTVGVYLFRYKNNDEVLFSNKLASYINNKNDNFIIKKYYKEFEIKFDEISKKDSITNSSENWDWEFVVKKEKLNNEFYISFQLLNNNNTSNNNNNNNNEINYIKTNLVFFIRNNIDYSFFKTKATENFVYFGESNNNMSINLVEDFTMNKFIKIEELNKRFKSFDSIIVGIYLCIYNKRDFSQENYYNKIRNNIINDYSVVTHAEDYFESTFNSNGVYNSINYTIGEYSWDFDVELINNRYDLKLKYLGKKNNNCGDPYINYVFILRKIDAYQIYEIKSSTKFIKLSDENKEIIEKSFISSDNDNKLKTNNLIVGVYIRIYQTDINNNIKTLTAEKAMEVFEEKLNEKNITFYPKEKWTLILKKDSRTGIFIHINQNSYMISGYWHPLRRHEGIIGQKINGIKTDVKNEISDAGYWAIAINEADNEFGYSYCKTYKENTNDKEIHSIESSQNSIKKKRSFDTKLTKEIFKDKFQLSDENLLYEDIFEWDIENWKGLKNENTKENFKLCGLNWNLTLYPHGSDKKDEYVSMALENYNALKYYSSDNNYKYNEDNQFNLNVPTVFVLYIRKYDRSLSYESYEAKNTTFRFNNIDYYHEITDLIEVNKLNEKILKDNKLTVGIYLRRYKNNNENEFKIKIESFIDDKNEKEIMKEQYNEINLSFNEIFKLNNNYTISNNDFNDGINNWNLSIEKKLIEGQQYLSFQLENMNLLNKIIKTNLVFYIRNCKDYSFFKTKATNNFLYFNTDTTNDSDSSIKTVKKYTIDKFINLNSIKDYFKEFNKNNSEIIGGIYMRIYYIKDFSYENYINIIRNHIINDYGIALYAESFFEYSLNLNNKSISDNDFNLGCYDWNFTVESKNNNTFELTLDYIENKNKKDFGNPYISYVFAVRKKNDYRSYNIKSSSKLIKVHGLYTTTENISVNINNNEPLMNEFIVGCYLRIYQTDNNDNIKIYTIEKAVEIFKNEIISKTDFIYDPNDNWTFTGKTNSGSGIFISIFTNKNTDILSAYWHPLRKHSAKIGKIFNGVRDYIKVIDSEAGYWAIATLFKIEDGRTFYQTYKEKEINYIEPKKEIEEKIKIKFKNSIENNNIDEIKSIIETEKDKNNKLNLNEKYKDGNYPILLALLKNNNEIVKLIIQYANENDIKLNLNEKNNYGYYPFLIAIRYYNDLNMAEKLIEYAHKNNITLEINETDIDNIFGIMNELIELFIKYNENIKIIYKNESELKEKIDKLMEKKIEENKEMDSIKKLIDNGKNLNDILITECTKNYYSVIKYLVDNGSELNVSDNAGNTPLLIAVQYCDLPIVKYLVENNATINVKNNKGETPLICALYKQKFPIIKYLIDKGADLNIKIAKNNKTPLYIACKNKMENVVKYILEKGVKIEKNELKKINKYIAKNEDYKNIENILFDYECKILIDACKNNNVNTINEIFEYGTDINIKNKYQNSLLIMASKLVNKNSINIFEKLIDNNADINYKGEYNMSPLLVACYFIKEEVISKLIEKNDNINVKDKIKNTPLIIAKAFAEYLNNSKILNLLREKNIINEDEIKNSTLNITYDDESFDNDSGNKGLNQKEIYHEENGKPITKKNKSIDENYIYNENDPKKVLQPIPSFDDIKDISNKSVCIIKLIKHGKKMFGTGFFVKLQYNDIIIYGLMTNNHVINGESQNFEIYFEERKENISIKSNDIKFIFTDEFIDVTFIELKNEVFNRITPYFLTADDRECVITDPIMVIQYPANEPKDKNLQENENIQKLSASIGIIKSISGCNIVHNCSTYFASSGSPLINNSLHVVGIHKSTSGNDNYSTRLSIAKNAIITTYERKRKNEINNTMGIVNELSPENYEELKNHNLVNRKDNKVFILEGNKSILPIHFYRTNYAWFWTNETIPDYEMETLKNLQWTIIIPHEKINKNEKGLSPIYKILIMWLRLSEFMYL